MTTLFHLFRMAIRDLHRGGWRVGAAFGCILLGVAALVATSSVARSMESAAYLQPAEILGGDMSLTRPSAQPLKPEDIARLNDQRASGRISEYTLVAYNNSALTFRRPDSGEIHPVGVGLGIDPASYPLAGALTIAEPGSIGLPSLLHQAGDVVVTRDLAWEYGLKPGDAIILSDLRTGDPVKGVVRGIASDTPNHQGDKFYYTLETADLLSGGRAAANTAVVNSPQAKEAAKELEGSGWEVDRVAIRHTSPSAFLWGLSFRSLGLLALLLSGVGVASIMQTLIRQRQHEIAVWKALGYRESQLHLLFLLEGGILGLAGSLAGSGLGILAGASVVEAVRRASMLLFTWSFSPATLLMGVGVGALTTLLFTFWAAVVSVQTRPSDLLGEGPLPTRNLPGCISAGLAVLLTLPLLGLSIWAMDSIPAGAAALTAILAAVVLLGGLFSALLWLTTRVVPPRILPIPRLALQSLRRLRPMMVLAMISLFAGAAALSLGLAIAQFSESRVLTRANDFAGYNLTVLGKPDAEKAIQSAVQALHPLKSSYGYRAALANLRARGDNDDPMSVMEPVLLGRDDPSEFILSGAAWGSRPDGVYAFHGANLKEGSQVEVALRDGTTRTLTVVGAYEFNFKIITLNPPVGLLIGSQGFKRLTEPDSISGFVQVEPGQAAQTASVLGKSLPDASVVDLAAYAARYMHIYRFLYILPLLLAVPLLLLGLLLTKNSVRLDLIERAEEIGALNAAGYTRRQILAMFAVEYGWPALLSIVVGPALLVGFLALLVKASDLTKSALLLVAPIQVLIVLLGTGLVVTVALGTARKFSQVAPAAVLNQES